jgi:hypothetical protein
MEGSLRMFIEWPNGSRLPVRLPSDATGDDLLRLLRFAFRKNQTILLLVNGTCLQPLCQLSRQQVLQDAVVRVVNFSDWFHELTDDEDSDRAAQSESGNAYDEMLRIRDLQYRHIEGWPKGGALYRALLEETSDDEETDIEQPPTIVAPRLAEIPTDPLPILTMPWEATGRSSWRW